MITKKMIVACVAGMAMLFCATATAQRFGTLQFPDILTSDYFFDAATRFAKKGIITGYRDGRFAPHDYVTRGQVAVIMDRYDQKVVEPLRAQIAALREQQGLGRCGDSQQQVGESCDDGNVNSGDGCSAQCELELHCAGGYKIGDRFPDTDGCNTCACTASGIACTEIACSQQKCFGSNECPADQICSVEEGDCRFPCPPGAVCIQACAGVCIPKTTETSCGDGTCDEGESAVPDRTGSLLYCPQDCETAGPVCGDGECGSGEADEYRLGDDGPILIRRGSCTEDCEGGGETSCEQKKDSIDAIFESNLACETDDDCALFSRGCSPYQTCGKAVLKTALLQVSAAVFGYVDECAGQEPPVCAGCAQVSVACINSVCTLVEETQN